MCDSDGLTLNKRYIQLGALASGRFVWGFCVAAVLSALSMAWAAPPAGTGAIYTCIDAKGRRLSSDRPIPECLDREQRELSGSGITRRVIPPAQSDAERAREAAAKQAQAQQRELEKARQREIDRRNQLMVTRYPNQAEHDAERQSQLELVQTAVAGIQLRQRELERQRKEYELELEFYKNDVNKAPPSLQRRFKTNDEQMAVQRQLLEHQDDERKRINKRFDDELIELKKLWDAQPQRATPSASPESNATPSTTPLASTTSSALPPPPIRPRLSY